MHTNDDIIELTDIIEEGAPITSGLNDFPTENAVDSKILDDELDAILEDVTPDFDPLAGEKASAPPQKEENPATATQVLDPDAHIVLGAGDDSPLAADDDLDIFADTPIVADHEPTATAPAAETAAPTAPATESPAPVQESDMAEEPSLGAVSAKDVDILTEPDLASLAAAPNTDHEAHAVESPTPVSKADASPRDESSLKAAQQAPTSPSPGAESPVQVLTLPEDPQNLPFFPALMALVLTQVDARVAAATSALRQEGIGPTAGIPDLDTWAAPLREELAALRTELAARCERSIPAAPEAAPSHGGILLEEAAALRQAVAAQNAEIEAVRAQVAAKDAEIAALKQQLAARDAQITALTARMEAFAQTINAVKTDLTGRLHALIEDEAPRVAARAIREELAALMAESGQG